MCKNVAEPNKIFLSPNNLQLNHILPGVQSSIVVTFHLFCETGPLARKAGRNLGFHPSQFQTQLQTSDEEWSEEMAFVSTFKDSWSFKKSHLSFFCFVPSNHVSTDMRLNEMSRSQVTNSTQKIECSIPHCYQGIFTEDDCFRPVGWLCKLAKYNPCHTNLCNIFYLYIFISP